MKKTLHLAFIYAILAMVAGVFYREFTKFNDFNGQTTLAFLHTHLFMLGMFMFLIITIFIKLFAIDKAKQYTRFLIVYNLGLLITITMLVVRGIVQVMQSNISNATSSMISGIAGLGHITLSVGIILLFLCLKECIKE